jgi:hypothetical protein
MVNLEMAEMSNGFELSASLGAASSSPPGAGALSDFWFSDSDRQQGMCETIPTVRRDNTPWRSGGLVARRHLWQNLFDSTQQHQGKPVGSTSTGTGLAITAHQAIRFVSAQPPWNHLLGWAGRIFLD